MWQLLISVSSYYLHVKIAFLLSLVFVLWFTAIYTAYRLHVVDKHVPVNKTNVDSLTIPLLDSLARLDVRQRLVIAQFVE